MDFLLDIFRSFNTVGVDSPSAVVELGCGPAKHSIEFGKRGIKATGVDRNEKMIEYAREKVEISVEEKVEEKTDCLVEYSFICFSFFSFSLS